MPLLCGNVDSATRLSFALLRNSIRNCTGSLCAPSPYALKESLATRIGRMTELCFRDSQTAATRSLRTCSTTLRSYLLQLKNLFLSYQLLPAWLVSAYAYTSHHPTGVQFHEGSLYHCWKHCRRAAPIWSWILETIMMNTTTRTISPTFTVAAEA